MLIPLVNVRHSLVSILTLTLSLVIEIRYVINFFWITYLRGTFGKK